MTQPEIDSAMLDTHRLSDAEAAALERDAGCLVVRLAPTRGRPVFVEAGQANTFAAHLAKDRPGQLYGVFKLARVYHRPAPVPSPDGESGAGA